MSIFRNYFSKNNTLIQNNVTNNSQNPVTEISYGTLDKEVSRYIFDVDLDKLKEKISNGLINQNRITKHVLHLTNTIRYAPEYIGKNSYLSDIKRASSFNLEVFNINQDWNEGGGYDFTYNNMVSFNASEQASNWYSAKTSTMWNNAGLYESGVTTVIGSQSFDNGNENIEIDITNYINNRLSNSGASYGLGIKFGDVYEKIEDVQRHAVAFHAKNTNTWYEPYVETIIDDTIIDDRNHFYLDKDNDLYLYVNIGGNNENVTINSVNVYDYEDNLIEVLTGNSITNVCKGVYKITQNISSSDYPDAVIFRDEWIMTINGKSNTYNGEFYLISQNNYYSFNNENHINFKNYHFNFWGIGENEHIKSGVVKRIMLTLKELYPNQNNNKPLDIEYRLFTTVGSKYEIDIIPFTLVNRTSNGHYFDLDTSWLIPQDYYLQVRLKNGNYYENMRKLSFTIVSDNII